MVTNFLNTSKTNLLIETMSSMKTELS